MSTWSGLVRGLAVAAVLLTAGTASAAQTTPGWSRHPAGMAGPPSVSSPLPVGSGSYLLTGTVVATGRWVTLAVDGATVYRAPATGQPQAVEVPVRVPAPGGSVTVVSRSAANGSPSGSAELSALQLTPAPPQLTAAGNRLYDLEGKPLTLRGVNRNGFEALPGSYWFSEYDVGWMRRWGANAVRLQLSEVFWLPTSCGYDPAYAGRIDDAVRWITSRGMVAVLDLHTNDPANACRGKPTQQLMADDASLDFWRSAAARYQGNPLVAFDLYNEPHGVDWQTWRDGGMVHDPVNGDWHAAGMQQLYDAVRSTGARNLVFVSGPGWSNDLGVSLTEPVAGYGIVYAPHIYAGDTCGLLRPRVVPTWPTAAAHYPVVITEFGTDCGSPTYVASVIRYAEANGMGWLAFAWNARPEDPRSYSLLQSWATHAPSVAGQPVYDALQAAAAMKR